VKGLHSNETCIYCLENTDFLKKKDPNFSPKKHISPGKASFQNKKAEKRLKYEKG